MKQLIGTDVGGYSFNAAAKTVTLTGLDPIAIEQILLIVNIDRNAIIYNPISSATGSTGFDGRILTLVYDTTTYANLDSLQIFVNLPAQSPDDILILLQDLLIAQKQTNEMLFLVLNQIQPNSTGEF